MKPTLPNVLPQSFYLRPTLDVARGLLGQTLVHEVSDGRISGKIVETEAYIGEEDQASHARAGRTTRTEVMYGTGGHAYLYLAYGMYWMLNLVTEEAGSPAAVLIRAVEPLEGRELMVANRGRGSGYQKTKRIAPPRLLEQNLTSGPARLALAFGLSGELKGHDLTRPPLYLEAGESVAASKVATSSRIGVGYAGEWAGRPWRFYLKGSPWVSRP